MENENIGMIEELDDCKNAVERNMVMQKYGILEPKLTPKEQEIVTYGIGDGTIVREAA
jgi:hypothetical protein